MKEVIRTIAKIFFGIFVAGLLAWTASLTVAEVKEILPNDPITPYFALVLFDGGALTWLGVWIYLARGLYQRAIALMIMIVDLAGVVLLAAGRLLMGGQDITNTPENLGMTIIWSVIGVTLANVTALYVYHLSEPEVLAAIESGILEDTLRQEAQEQAKDRIRGEAKVLGGLLALRESALLKYRMGLPMSADEQTAFLQVSSGGMILDASFGSEDAGMETPLALPQVSRTAPASVPFFAKWITGLRRAFRPAPSSPLPVAQNTPAPQPAPEQPAPAPMPLVNPPDQSPTPAEPVPAPVSPNVPAAPQTEQEGPQPWQPPFVLPKRKPGDNGGTPASEEPTVSPS
jgi:hypothetical protein